MDDHLKQVWTASAAVESLQGEMDQAETHLDLAIDEAIKAGAAAAEISGAANLSPTELDQRVQSLGPDAQAAEESGAGAL